MGYSVLGQVIPAGPCNPPFCGSSSRHKMGSLHSWIEWNTHLTHCRKAAVPIAASGFLNRHKAGMSPREVGKGKVRWCGLPWPQHRGHQSGGRQTQIVPFRGLTVRTRGGVKTASGCRLREGAEKGLGPTGQTECHGQRSLHQGKCGRRGEAEPGAGASTLREDGPSSTSWGRCRYSWPGFS